MGSHNVVGEARSWVFGVGLNAYACFEFVTAEPLPPCTR